MVGSHSATSGATGPRSRSRTTTCSRWDGPRSSPAGASIRPARAALCEGESPRRLGSPEASAPSREHGRSGSAGEPETHGGRSGKKLRRRGSGVTSTAVRGRSTAHEKCRDAGKIDEAPGDSLARSADQWLVVKVGGGPRLVTAAPGRIGAPSPEHLNGRAQRTPATGACTSACVVPVGGS